MSMDKRVPISLATREATLDARAIDKQVGLLLLSTDHTTEVDFQRLVANERIGVYSSRIPYANPVTPENLRAMQPSLTAAAALILPSDPLDVVVYSCTSASVLIGDAVIEAAIKSAKPTASVVTPAKAAVLGLKAMKAKRISILTPYTIETSEPMAEYFASHGFDIASFTCLGLEDDRDMARISQRQIIDFAKDSMTRDSDALFISCTALRAATVAPDIEKVVGKPVVTSNLATAWACLRLCGDDTMSPAFGKLMSFAYANP